MKATCGASTHCSQLLPTFAEPSEARSRPRISGRPDPPFRPLHPRGWPAHSQTRRDVRSHHRGCRTLGWQASSRHQHPNPG